MQEARNLYVRGLWNDHTAGGAQEDGSGKHRVETSGGAARRLVVLGAHRQAVTLLWGLLEGLCFRSHEWWGKPWGRLFRGGCCSRAGQVVRRAWWRLRCSPLQGKVEEGISAGKQGYSNLSTDMCYDFGAGGQGIHGLRCLPTS
jgi:hypothetical protein